jgi:hypothetical protein
MRLRRYAIRKTAGPSRDFRMGSKTDFLVMSAFGCRRKRTFAERRTQLSPDSREMKVEYIPHLELLSSDRRPMTWARDQIRAKAPRRRGVASGRPRSIISKGTLEPQRSRSTRLWKLLGKGNFPKKQILTREQARFIIYCLAYDRIKQKATRSRYHSYGLLTRLAKRFGVTRECIVQIDRRRIWRSINRPKPKQLFFIEGDPK